MTRIVEKSDRHRSSKPKRRHGYAEYRQVKKDMQEYLIAKQTVETILNIDKKKEQEKEQKKPLR